MRSESVGGGETDNRAKRQQYGSGSHPRIVRCLPAVRNLAAGVAPRVSKAAGAVRSRGRPACLRTRVVTSGRRWERHGVLRTIVLMWRLRLEYALGADPHRLARRYGVERTSA